jgi:hypothetical protein
MVLLQGMEVIVKRSLRMVFRPRRPRFPGGNHTRKIVRNRTPRGGRENTPIDTEKTPFFTFLWNLGDAPDF